jgi:HEAT repeat protein
MKHTCNIPLNAPPYIRQAAIESDNVVKDHRKEAIEIVATAHYSDAHDILIAALHHPITDVRQGVITALGEIKDSTAIPALQEVLHDPEGVNLVLRPLGG